VTGPGPGTLYVNRAPVDGSLVFLPLNIQHGRSSVYAQPDAPVMEFETFGPDPLCKVGDLVEFEAGARRPAWSDPGVIWGDPGTSWTGDALAPVLLTTAAPRFTGTVTSVTALESFGDVDTWAVRAVGTQARLGRIRVLLDRPDETDTARVAAIAADAGVSVTILGSPSLTLAADSIDRDALGALHEVCQSTGGLLWQDRSGDIFYGTANHRGGAVETTLPAGAILDGIEWTQDTAQIINHLTISWPSQAAQQSPGQHAGDTEQQTYTDDDSIAQWGQRHAEATTLCSDSDEAGLLALTILARRSQPFWHMPGVMIPMMDLSPVNLEAVGSLTVSEGVALPVGTEPSPTPALPRQWAVEGWAEEWSEEGRWMQLALSDWARSSSAVLRDYGEVLAGFTYGTARAKTYQRLLAEVI
jgi:hypothetical protein